MSALQSVLYQLVRVRHFLGVLKPESYTNNLRPLRARHQEEFCPVRHRQHLEQSGQRCAVALPVLDALR